jgi:cyclic beta-1,2-glucan synthetase
LTTPATLAPRTHLLSNQRYHVMLTNAGSGSSRCFGLDLTRWREDPTCERWGQFFYVRDVHGGPAWSAAHQPVCRPADDYEVIFAADKATFRRRDGEIETLLEVTISPEELAEVRRITLTNLGSAARELEVTSYLEPVLNFHAADLAHPAFGKLFLETERIAASGGLLARRRPRSSDEDSPCAVHVLAIDRGSAGFVAVGDQEYETDRGRFVGRGRTLAAPAALDPGERLSGTNGAVLDPILSLRQRVRIEPGGTASIGFTLAMAESREAAAALADKYQGINAVARAFELSWAHCQVEHASRGWSPQDSHLYQRLGSHLIFAGSLLRSIPPDQGRHEPGRPAWERAGLTGDLPIALAKVADEADLDLVRQLLTAHDFLRLKGLEFDLVLLNGEEADEAVKLEEQLRAAIAEARLDDLFNRPGGIVLLRRGALGDDEARMLEHAARVVLDAARGLLPAQLDRIERLRPLPEPLDPADAPRDWHDEPASLPAGLQFFNGLGGFSADGREYCLRIEPQELQERETNGRLNAGAGQRPALPPAPWTNVVANPRIGFLVTESGSGFTWAGNSQTNRLTPWSNDPVMDPPGEVIYLRDEATGEFWCPTPLPVASAAPTVVSHGQGYSRFTRNLHGLEHELTLLVPPDDPVKILRLRVRNVGPGARDLSATLYAEWVLGRTRDQSAMHVVTEVDHEQGALLARNPFREDLAASVAFADVNRRPRTLTADRVEFLGRHGSVAAPAALARGGLSGRTGTALDPCAAIQAPFSLAPGEAAEIIFLLGEAEDQGAVHDLLRRYGDAPSVERAAGEAIEVWDRRLGAVQVQTPDPAFDLLLNRWLLYQVTSCRLWARSAFFQSGGAYGFRDQLQDVLALVHAAPELARSHLLLAASRQFAEGDVQHWWHPPGGRGVRTRISDDFLWLVAAAVRYVEATGDAAVLDEQVAFLAAPPLGTGQEDDVRVPAVGAEAASLYEHCVRALERGKTLGPHGLPLIGGGDWNDGFNRVGPDGKGESVWLAWFLANSLRGFAAIAEARGDCGRSARDREYAGELLAAVEEHAWDGSWYLRAFCDDGTALGSAANRECQIDSIAQSWAVIAGGREERGRQAVQAACERLFRREPGMVLLLAPPFDRSPIDPGYIKGYPPGVRENGAQYTHAATWLVDAAAALGQGRLAHELFAALNPINHTRDATQIARYRGEPYALAGDVLSLAPHEGRAGWTWYTGAAAWFYRVGLESILGIRRVGASLSVAPCIPPAWDGFQVEYRFGSSRYQIAVENPHHVERGVLELSLDGQPCAEGKIPLSDDGKPHDIRVIMGASQNIL